MKRFYLFFIPFVALLTLGGYSLYEEGQLMYHYFLVSGLLLSVYFFVPVMKQPFVLYIAMNILILVYHVFLLDSMNMFMTLLHLFLAMDSIVRLSINLYRIFMVINIGMVLSFLYYQQNLQLEWVALFLLVAVSLLKLNEYVVMREEHQDTYEKLLSEYRVLKRQTYESERAARLEERTKIARDIHDSVGHKLTALLMRLQMLSLQEKKQEYEELKELASTSLEETRQAVRQLQLDEHEGLSTVLQLIRKLEAESHIYLDFTLRQGVLSAPLTNEQNVALYRVLQESLTNAMRHAHSREVKVVLALDAIGDLTFTVKNNIHTKEKFEWGFGLKNMKKRLEELRGDLEVYQSETEFIVTGKIPLEDEKRGV